ncbi:MAG: DUF6538 domain-containing protein [Kiritimatiellales bacterium]
MVVNMTVDHVTLRGKIFYFRMRVPKDCLSAIGRREIVQSLKTDDPVKAKIEAKKLTALWMNEFHRIRTASTQAIPVSKSSMFDPDVFRQSLKTQWDQSLPEILDQEDDSSLVARIKLYGKTAGIVGERGDDYYISLEEIGIQWPLTPLATPGQNRIRKRTFCKFLQQMRNDIATALDKSLNEIDPPIKTAVSVTASRTVTASSQMHDLSDVAELMIAAKQRIAKTIATIRADIRILKEWTGRTYAEDFTKEDLIGFVRNCLPYIPANMVKKREYKGLPLQECIRLTKTSPETFAPISAVTCENRLGNIIAVFKYAKDDVGCIVINPAKGIEVPQIHIQKDVARGFTQEELNTFWQAIQPFALNSEQPSRYWVSTLSLYHGFRLNEICQLRASDVYDDSDGITVIDINEKHELKLVKNDPSIRIIPVHPYVLNDLDFKAYIARRKADDTNGLLFPDLTFVTSKGYGSKISTWFARWKKVWLPTESLHKHFHDFRYTWTQYAQNVAKIPDRYAQEITGHAVEGVSKVHLGYSGRLKPVDLLVELKKVQYGWEADS